jgi:glycosyltransferase involved in cell wall biosynthesis
MNELPKTLFVGRPVGALGWYRCALPAISLGCDWVGLKGDPPNFEVVTGNALQSGFSVDGYDVVVLQMPAGNAWVKTIREWQARGITVIYEIDDWLHGVRKVEHHRFRDDFTKEAVARFEAVMEVADGVICSTEWLAKRLRKHNPRTWVCRNAIDLRRYAYTRPPRENVTVGWAGGIGHLAAAKPWLLELAHVMRERDEVRFVSVGDMLASSFVKHFGPERAQVIPFLPFEVYPAALSHFDIALAPAGKGGFFQGKSDLRWLEASAARIPLVADPDVYPEIEHGVTGFHASTPAEMRAIVERLVKDPELRHRIGEQAYEYVAAHRSVPVGGAEWAAVLREVAGEQKLAA